MSLASTLSPVGTVRCLFYGLGSDGTVGANKNSIKIIGEGTDLHTQGYFVYDSKKSGSVTISHLRFGPQPIHAPYLIGEADFIACHQFGFLERFSVLDSARPGATFLLTAHSVPRTCGSVFLARSKARSLRKSCAFMSLTATPSRRTSAWVIA